LLVLLAPPARAQLPNPILTSVFPPGGQAGKSVELTVAGNALEDVTKLICSRTEITFEKVEDNRFRARIPESVPAGSYDLRALCRNGLSSPRTFFVGNRPELLESDPNESLKLPQSAALDLTINGRIEKAGDLDFFQFSAKRGQRVIIECCAERIDSSLRAILEVFDARGKRLAVNRGYYGIDPMIDFLVPADGTYVVKVFDLVYSGSADHFYRLDIDTGPRVSFAVPSVIELGKTTRVTLYGWNLSHNKPDENRKVAGTSFPEFGILKESPGTTIPPARSDTVSYPGFDRIEVDISPPEAGGMSRLRRTSRQVTVDGFAYQLPGSHAPIFLGSTDVPVVQEKTANQTPASAMEITIPCEVSGQLIAGDEKDWYAIEARRGEVLWFDALGERIGSPVDLELNLLDSTGKNVLEHFGDEVRNIGGKRFPSSHLDPAGRWIVPADGRYLIMVRNLIGDLKDDPRRVYRLSIRRQEPEFHLALMPHRDDPASLNINRRGRTLLDVIAFRSRGMTGSIRVRANHLPEGIHCPEIWLGPGVDRAPLTVTADDNAAPDVVNLQLEGSADLAGSRTVRGGTIVRTGVPNGSSRLTTEIPLAVAGEAELRITADGHEKRSHHLYGEMTIRHAPGSVLDVAVHVERSDPSHSAPVKLIGVGVPDLIRNQTATIPAGKKKGYISFYLPPTLPPGRYTVAVEAQTTVPKSSNGKKQESRPVTVFSNPVTFEVKPAAFTVEVDPFAPKKIHRGEIVQVNYTARRINGFINKIHTELDAAEKIEGLRVRGVTFVGQTDSGTLQIIANDDAPLGKQPFLRLFAVGVLEDQPVYHGSCFLDLEIVE